MEADELKAKIEKLPRWARRHIDGLDLQLQDQARLIESLSSECPTDTGIRVELFGFASKGPGRSVFGLSGRANVVFTPDASKPYGEIELSLNVHNPDALTVRGMFYIEPECGNGVLLRPMTRRP